MSQPIVDIPEGITQWPFADQFAWCVEALTPRRHVVGSIGAKMMVALAGDGVFALNDEEVQVVSVCMILSSAVMCRAQEEGKLDWPGKGRG